MSTTFFTQVSSYCPRPQVEAVPAPNSHSSRTEDGPEGPEMQAMRTFATSRFSADLVALDIAESSPTGGVEVQRFLKEAAGKGKV